MPRAKRPKRFLGTYQIDSLVILKDADKQSLAICLGIENNKNCSREMVAEVEKYLTEHKILVEELDQVPTIYSKLNALASLKRAAEELEQQLRRLDVYTKQTLYSYAPAKAINFQCTSEDPNADYLSDVGAVLGLIHRNGNAINSLDKVKKRGRRKKASLRTTMLSLSLAYYKYAKKNKKRNKFISLALTFADIEHPNPSECPTRFNALLKK